MAPTQIPAQQPARAPIPPARVAHIDVMRALAILSVILGHGFAVLAGGSLPFSAAVRRAVALIYAVHMPLFFFLSGLVYRRRSWRQVLSRALSFLLMTEGAMLLFLLLKEIFLHSSASIGSVLRGMLFLDYIGPAPVWFLVAFAAVSVTVKLALDGGKRGAIAAAAIFLLSFADSSFFAAGIRIFQLQAWWPGIIALLVGIRVGPFVRERLDPSTLHGWKVWAGLGAGMVVAGGITCFAALGNHGCTFSPGLSCGEGIFHVRQVVGSYGFLPLFLLGMLAGFVAVVSGAVILARLLPERSYGVIGRNTLALYLLNAFAIEFTNTPLRTAVGIFYPVSLPAGLVVGLPLALVALHLLVMPAVIPVVQSFERSSKRLAEGVVGAFSGGKLPAEKRMKPNG